MILEEAGCKKIIKEGVNARLFVLCGGESFLKRHYSGQIRAAATTEEQFQEFNVHVFEGSDVSLVAIARATEALPLGSARTCVLVRDFPLEKYNGDKEFEAVIAELPEHCTLIFWMDLIEFHPKKYKKLTELFCAVGHVVVLDPPDLPQMLRIISSGAKARGCQIDRATAEYFIASVGGDLNLLQNELQKLCDFAHMGQITREQIDCVCVKSLDAKAFDLVKAVISGESRAAFQTLDELFRQKIAPQMILGSLVAQVADLLRAGCAKISGHSLEETAALFDYKGKTFRLQNAARTLGTFSFSSVLHALQVLDDTDRKLKFSALGDRIVMEQCLLELLFLRKNKS